jgi:hypothetical protein
VSINRWSDIEERKRNETDAKAGDELPADKKGDAASRLQASEGPKENEEKREVVRSSRNGSPSAEESLPVDRTFVSRDLERRERR